MDYRWAERVTKNQRTQLISEEESYQRDRSRIIHSSAFRRLQGKTQILALGESDFYRTRLTHSLEVAQITSGICIELKKQAEKEVIPKEAIPPTFLIEGIALAHDLGHPPFGHDGERTLYRIMKHKGGFEGNAQTLRLITTLGEYSFEDGYNLTRRTLLGIIKYPIFYSEALNTNDNGINPPKCIYDEDKIDLEWILEPLSTEDKDQFLKIESRGNKHHRSRYKSLDCSIMELADDIAYGVHDLEDALTLGFINEHTWNAEVLQPLKDKQLTDVPLIKNSEKYGKNFYTENLFSKEERARKHAISILVGYFIRNTKIESFPEFYDPLLKYNVDLNQDAKECLAILKTVVYNHVIKRPQVKALEFKGDKILSDLFNVYLDNHSFLPEGYIQNINAENQYRLVCDYVAGMTDAYASKQYQKFFLPDFGSIYDL